MRVVFPNRISMRTDHGSTRGPRTVITVYLGIGISRLSNGSGRIQRDDPKSACSSTARRRSLEDSNRAIDRHEPFSSPTGILIRFSAFMLGIDLNLNDVLYVEPLVPAPSSIHDTGEFQRW
jgi:hypothetical protein